MDRTKELEDQIRRLSLTIDEMRGRMARLEGGDRPSDDGRRNRRGFLRMGAAAAAGALGWMAVKAVPAAAATGSYMVVGCPNVAEASTTLADDSGGGISGGEVLGVQSKNFSQSGLNTALAVNSEAFNGPLRGLGDSTGLVEGIDAWADGSTAYAVWGMTDTGTAITGEALHGIGLYARVTGRIRQDPQLAAGLPGYSPNLMEQVRDSNGVLWIHNALGAWRRVNTVRTDAASGSGNPFKPIRVLDTRLTSSPPTTGGKPSANTLHAVTIAGVGSGDSTIPSDAIAVVGNLTATQYGGPGFMAIMPQGVSFNPNADPSSLNFIVGQGAIANAFIVGLNPSNGQVQVYVGGVASHFIVDITGYIQ